MKRFSLRLKLIKSLVPPLLITTVLIGTLSVLSIFHEVDEVYDATLVQFAKTLASTAGYTPTHAENTFLAHKYERNISYRIVQNGKLLSQSVDASVFEDLEPPPGFSEQTAHGRTWRFFTFIDEKTGRTIEVAEKYDIRNELTYQLLSSLILPSIIFLIVSVVVIWIGVTHGLQKLVHLSTEVDRRKAKDLTPISDTSVPLEIQPLLDALNRLFARLDESFLREREFTDNAAHELRTPLAAMKTQAQVLIKTETFTPAGQQGFDNLLASIDRAVGMTESLLSFARLQADNSQKNAVDLSPIVQREAAALEKFAAQKDISIRLDCAETIFVQGVGDALATMVRNIIQNAIKFTPAGGKIGIALKHDDKTAYLTVTDTGPGIADAYKEKVFERFFRTDKSAQSGSGLGLAMVKWIVDAHGAHIDLLDNTPSGLIVKIDFPLERK